MELVALLSTGKGSWVQIAGLIERGEWDKIVLIGSDFAKKFMPKKESTFVSVDLDQPLRNLKADFIEKLRGKIRGSEVALSIASGDGKEHMALMSALLNLPVGIRFVALTKDGVIEF
jgi:hypothetical protein